ncbi:MAG TPA: SDR family NAD(P)-dependent oxidoreductase [Limnochordales bacterium]
MLITGASSGIGRALAVELGRFGARVGLLARREAALREAAAAVAAAGGQALVLPGDVTHFAQVQAAVQTVVDRWGGVDVLVANAGTARPRNPFDPVAVAALMAVNFQGAVNAVGAVLPVMQRQGGGRLVAVSSLAAVRGFPQGPAYAASKAAMAAYFEALRSRLRPHGILVTIVRPGFVETEMTAGAGRLPLMVPAERAAVVIRRGIERGRTSIDFPWLAARAIGLVRWLPDGLFDRLVGGIPARQD